MLALGVAMIVLHVICWIILLVSAFQDEIWKGIVGLICGCYLFYYAVFEFDHEYKWAIVLLWLLGGSAGTAILRQAHVF